MCPYAQGGVLYVIVKRALGLPHKPLHRGRFGKRKTALRVRVAGQEKRSPTAKGEDPIFPEPLVFLLGARPRAGGQGIERYKKPSHPA